MKWKLKYNNTHLFHHFFVGSSILTGNHKIWVVVNSMVNRLRDSHSLNDVQEKWVVSFTTAVKWSVDSTLEAAYSSDAPKYDSVVSSSPTLSRENWRTPTNMQATAIPLATINAYPHKKVTTHALLESSVLHSTQTRERRRSSISLNAGTEFQQNPEPGTSQQYWPVATIPL
jgi:hypothetical protein